MFALQQHALGVGAAHEPARLCPVDYIHHVPSRLRLRAEALKRDPSRFDTILPALADLPGVHAVTPNLVIGSITIGYDPSLLAPSALCGALRDCGLSVTSGDNGRRIGSSGERIAEKLLELVFERLAISLIAAVI